MNERTIYRGSSFILGVLLLMQAATVSLSAHGGEDHGEAAPATVSTPGTAENQLVTDGTTSLFELLLKYPLPETGEGTPVRMFLSDYATNRAIENAAFQLSFKPAGVVVAQQPRMLSPGIYEMNVEFPEDTVYSMVATVTAGQRTDFVEVRNIYAGEAAATFLAEHSPGAETTQSIEEGLRWWEIALLAIAALGLVSLLSVIIARRRNRTSTIVIASLGLVMIERLVAHGGEDHGEAAPVAQPSLSAGAGISVAKEQQFALGMLTELVAERDLDQTLQVTGRVIPRTDAVADVVAPIGGRVVGGALPKLGERVRRGQVLFRVAQVLSPSERTSLRTEQARARAELHAAEREVSRLEKLEGVVAGKQIIDARIRRDAAREVYNALSAQLSGAGSTVSVTAPISGEIISAEIAAGEVLDGSRVLYRIADLSKVWIEANLFEKDIPLVQGATRADVRTEAVPGRSFIGTLYRIGGEVDPETRSIQALFVVDNPDARLKLNMSASVGVITSARADVLSIPRASVIESGARRVVFVHTAPERFDVRDVTPGSSSDGDYLEVRAGVVRGDRVVVTGTHQLRAVAGL